MRRLLKFKMAGNGKLSIAWTRTNDVIEEDDILSLESVEEPSNELVESWERLRVVLITLIELPPEWFEDHELTMKALSISYKNGKRTFTLSGSVELDFDNKPLNLTSPAKPESDEATFGAIDEQDVAMIDDFIDHVWEYVDGVRSQPSLFGKQEEAI